MSYQMGDEEQRVAAEAWKEQYCGSRTGERHKPIYVGYIHMPDNSSPWGDEVPIFNIEGSPFTCSCCSAYRRDGKHVGYAYLCNLCIKAISGLL